MSYDEALMMVWGMLACVAYNAVGLILYSKAQRGWIWRRLIERQQDTTRTAILGAALCMVWPLHLAWLWAHRRM